MHMFFTTFRFALIATATLMSQGAEAQTPAPVPDSAVIDACRATGLVALKERSPARESKVSP